MQRQSTIFYSLDYYLFNNKRWQTGKELNRHAHWIMPTKWMNKMKIWCGYSLTIAWNNNNGEVYGTFFLLSLRMCECILKVCKLSVGSNETKITDMCHFKDITSNATAFLRDYTFFSPSLLLLSAFLCVFFFLYPVDFLLKPANFLCLLLHSGRKKETGIFPLHRR